MDAKLAPLSKDAYQQFVHDSGLFLDELTSIEHENSIPVLLIGDHKYSHSLQYTTRETAVQVFGGVNFSQFAMKDVFFPGSLLVFDNTTLA